MKDIDEQIAITEKLLRLAKLQDELNQYSNNGEVPLKVTCPHCSTSFTKNFKNVYFKLAPEKQYKTFTCPGCLGRGKLDNGHGIISGCCICNETGIAREEIK